VLDGRIHIYRSLLGQDLVAGQGVSLGVVGANTVWELQGLVRVMIARALVVDKVGNIGRGEVRRETSLLILDFVSGQFVVVVKHGVVNELLVEDGLEHELEVAHETGVVAVTILSEDRHEAVVLLVLHILRLGLGREADGSLDEGAKGDGVEGTDSTHLLSVEKSTQLATDEGREVK